MGPRRPWLASVAQLAVQSLTAAAFILVHVDLVSGDYGWSQSLAFGCAGLALVLARLTWRSAFVLGRVWTALYVVVNLTTVLLSGAWLRSWWR